MFTQYYTAANTQEENGGIYGYDRNSEQTFFEPLRGASYLAFSPDKTLLYAVSRNSSDCLASVYQIREDGSLILRDQRATHGKATCHLTTDPSGRFLYCANYLTGNFNEFRLKNGLFQGPESERMITLHGKLGPNPDRQTSSHAHCTVFTPDGKYLCVVDLGLDEVQLFPFSRETGVTETPSFRYRSERPGAGPRHLLFSPDGTTAWLANEVDNTVSVLHYENGTLTHRQTLSTLPEDFTEKNTVAAVRLSADGNFLCVSNRGHNSFACYRVDDQNGLTLHDIIPCGGAGPRDVNFLPDEKTFACCNENSHDVTYFQYNQLDGSFTPLSLKQLLPGPLCLVYC